MNRHQIEIAILATVAVAAGPIAPESADDDIRRGNVALAAGDLAAADAYYARAEDRTDDPGLVAYNRGVVALKRGDDRAAELAFRRTLGDPAASAKRRAKAYYNLGHALVRQAGNDRKRLRDAATCYERCLESAADPTLISDAKHNLELAKLLWLKATAGTEPPPERDGPDEPKDKPTPKDKAGPDEPKKDPGGSKTPAGPPEEVKGGTPKEGEPKATDQRPPPGAGTLPVLPDADDVKPLSTDDAKRSCGRRRSDCGRNGHARGRWPGPSAGRGRTTGEGAGDLDFFHFRHTPEM